MRPIEEDPGYKAMLVQERAGTLRWGFWVDEQFAPSLALVNHGVRHFRAELTLETAA